MADRAHILVVDDEPQITRVLRTSLAAQGYDIRVANSGEMALEIMKDWQPHLIITDLSMPSIDGVQLCRHVRTISQVPIVVLSVRDNERQKVEALDAGADDYVTKPFGMSGSRRESVPTSAAFLPRRKLIPSSRSETFASTPPRARSRSAIPRCD